MLSWFQIKMTLLEKLHLLLGTRFFHKFKPILPHNKFESKLLDLSLCNFFVVVAEYSDIIFIVLICSWLILDRRPNQTSVYSAVDMHAFVASSIITVYADACPHFVAHVALL